MTSKAAALALMCIASPLAAQSFEGTVTMNMVSDDGSAHAISYMIKGGKMRFDVGGGQMSVIVDPVAQRMTTAHRWTPAFRRSSADFACRLPAIRCRHRRKPAG